MGLRWPFFSRSISFYFLVVGKVELMSLSSGAARLSLGGVLRRENESRASGYEVVVVVVAV